MDNPLLSCIISNFPQHKNKHLLRYHKLRIFFTIGKNSQTPLISAILRATLLALSSKTIPWLDSSHEHPEASILPYIPVKRQNKHAYLKISTTRCLNELQISQSLHDETPDIARNYRASNPEPDRSKVDKNVTKSQAGIESRMRHSVSEPDELLDTRTPRFSVQSTPGFSFDVSIDASRNLLLNYSSPPA